MSVQTLLIDGTNLSFRIFHVAQSYKKHNGINDLDLMTRYLDTFKLLAKRFTPMDIYMSWDSKISYNSTNFRKEMLNNTYKAGRVKPDDVNLLYEEEPKIASILSTIGVKHIYPNVLEADDVLAWLSRKLSGPTVIVSVDQDLLQLVDNNISIWNLKKLITKDNFEEMVGVPLDKFLLYKAILGDSSDNIPGLPGYGKIRSRRLALEWNEANLTKEFKDIIERNLKLIDLHYGYKIETGEIDAYQMQLNKENVVNKSNMSEFQQLCEKYNLQKELEQIRDWKKITNRNNLVSIINTLIS